MRSFSRFMLRSQPIIRPRASSLVYRKPVWSLAHTCFFSNESKAPQPTQRPQSQQEPEVPDAGEQGQNQNEQEQQKQHEQEQQKQGEQKQERQEEEEQETGKAGRPVSWRAVIATAIVCTGTVIGVKKYKNNQNVRLKSGRTVGKPKLGGDYEGLIDSDGKERSSQEFRGRYQLIYFGFVKCPDICPTELKKMQKSFALLRVQLRNTEIVPVFISVDPTRDTPAALKEYSQQWMPEIQWLTGPIEQIGQVAKLFRVYFSVPEVEEGDDDDYLVDHSIFFYLMDRQGKLMEIYGKNHTAEEMATGIAESVSRDLAQDA